MHSRKEAFVLKRAIARTITTIAAAAGLAVAIPSSAQAADSWLFIPSDHEYGLYEPASMMHFDNGDEFIIWDKYADGHGVLGSVYFNGSAVAAKYNGLGANRSVSFTYNILEGKKYEMRLCLVDGASDPTPSRCVWKDLYE